MPKNSCRKVYLQNRIRRQTYKLQLPAGIKTYNQTALSCIPKTLRALLQPSLKIRQKKRFLKLLFQKKMPSQRKIQVRLKQVWQSSYLKTTLKKKFHEKIRTTPKLEN